MRVAAPATCHAGHLPGTGAVMDDPNHKVSTMPGDGLECDCMELLTTDTPLFKETNSAWVSLSATGSSELSGPTASRRSFRQQPSRGPGQPLDDRLPSNRMCHQARQTQVTETIVPAQARPPTD